MNRQQRWSVLIACSVALSLLLTARPAQAEMVFGPPQLVDEIRGQYVEVSGPIFKKDPPAVQLFFMMGQVTGTFLAGMPVGTPLITELIHDLGADGPKPFNSVFLVDNHPMSKYAGMQMLVFPVGPGASDDILFSVSGPAMLNLSEGKVIHEAVTLLSDPLGFAGVDLSPFLGGAIFKIEFNPSAGPSDGGARWSLTAVPEPASVTLFLIGVAGMGVVGLRRYRSTA